MPRGDQAGACTASVVGESSRVAQDDSPRYQGSKRRIFRCHGRMRHRGAPGLRKFGESRSRRRAWPPIPYIMCPCAGTPKDAAIETTRHAFAYVFAGSGKSAMRRPLEVPTEPVVGRHESSAAPKTVRIVLFDRGDDHGQAGDDGSLLLVSGSLAKPAGLVGHRMKRRSNSPGIGSRKGHVS